MSITEAVTIFTDQPIFSIIIPTFNRPELLGRAIESIVRQDFKNIEVIVVDDGSSVSYDAIIEKYVSVITVYVRNSLSSGVSVARNRGIFLAKGAWTVFLDDDDEFDSGYLLYLYDYIRENNIDMAFLWSSIKTCQYDKDGKLIDISLLSYVEKQTNLENVFDDALTIGASYGLVVSRAAYYKVGLFDSSLIVGEDTELIVRLLDNAITPHPLSKVGVIKHNHVYDRLSLDYQKYSLLCVYEKIFNRHKDFLMKIPNTYKKLLNWSAIVHYRNGNYCHGDKALRRMFLVRPITFSSFEQYIGGKLVKFGVRFPMFKKRIDDFFIFYEKLNR